VISCIVTSLLFHSDDVIQLCVAGDVTTLWVLSSDDVMSWRYRCWLTLTEMFWVSCYIAARMTWIWFSRHASGTSMNMTNSTRREVCFDWFRKTLTIRPRTMSMTWRQSGNEGINVKYYEPNDPVISIFHKITMCCVENDLRWNVPSACLDCLCASGDQQHWCNDAATGGFRGGAALPTPNSPFHNLNLSSSGRIIA